MKESSGVQSTEKQCFEDLFLDKNERSERPPDWVLEALAQLPPESVWKYPDRRPLERGLADKFKLSEDQVWATSGSDQAIRALFEQLHPETTVVLPQPIFIVFPTVARQLGLQCIEVPQRPDFSIDLIRIKELAGELRDALLVLTRPNNPTGELIPRADLIDILRLSRDRDLLVLLDEAYVEFSNDSMVNVLPEFDHLLILRTFSKAFGLAGLRVGCLLGDADLVRGVKERALPYEVASTSLYIAKRALEPDAEADVARYCQRVGDNRRELAETLRVAQIEVTNSAANFLLLRMHPTRAQFLAAVLRQRGIRARHFRRADLRGCLRFSIPANIETLRRALTEALSPELICLDVDGTLIDTRPSFDEVIRILVKRWTGRDVNGSAIDQKRLQGGFNDDYDVAHALIEEAGIAAPLDEIAAQGTMLYLGDEANPGLCAAEQPLIKEKLLKTLCERFHVALVTGRSRRELRPALALLGVSDGILTITTDDVNKKKPDPEGILRAADRFNAKRIWMVGDNADDMAAARAAGAIPIAVGTHAQALLKAGAAIALDNINEIEDLL